MNKFKYVLSLIITMLLQTTLLSVTPIAGAKINLVLVFTISLCILHGDRVGAYTGLALGLIQDIMFGQVLGVRALLYFLIGTFVGRSLYNNDHHIPTGIFISFVMTLVYWLGTLLFMIFMGTGSLVIPYLKGPVFLEAALNALLYVPVMAIVRKVLKPESVQKYSGF